jgi:hypothetical protein
MDLVGKYEVKRRFVRPRNRWEDKFTTNAKKWDGKA